MKRGFFFILVGVLSLVFVACGAGGAGADVDYVMFDVPGIDDGSEQYSLAVLNLIPNQEQGSMNTSFKLSYPNAMEDSQFMDLDAQAEVGGEYYDEFLSTLDSLTDEFTVEQEDSDFFVTVSRNGEETKYYFSTYNANENFKDILEFYHLIIGMFLDDVY